ncbi:MAG TPA: enoyl-[acyl-carrier-protein] reductase FabK [Deltaproteobacteria bacterium]|nr:enoyl-[acyl-carrier-protein] reductase FabK [Deltaproteobacteria bacterium]
MFHTDVCDLLGIEYPIILGGMVWIGKADLAAAVSEAGGLGLLGAGGMTIEEIHSECSLVKEKTSKPFGVNLPMIRPDISEMIDASIESGASVVVTSSGNPKSFTRVIKERGCAVMHVVPSVSYALKCVEAGVDIIIAEGIEAGGHDGFDEITTMALIPQVVDAVDVPVIAAGGIADGRGFVAALSLGAKGVQLGTRFVATYESAAHPRFKDAILQLPDNGTTITGRTTIGPTRSMKNTLTQKIQEAERQGASAQELFDLIGEGRSAMASIEGDIEEGSAYCGQIGGMIRELKSVSDVFDEILAQARDTITQIRHFSEL